MDRYDLINKMVTEKSDYNPKEIDLEAYRNGLNDMYGELESKLNNNEVLNPVSHCPLCNSDNLHQYKLHHIHCKDCKEDFNKSCR